MKLNKKNFILIMGKRKYDKSWVIMIESSELYIILALISANVFFIVYTMIKRPEKGWIHR